MRPFDRRERLAGETSGWLVDVQNATLTRKHAPVSAVSGGSSSSSSRGGGGGGKVRGGVQMTYPCAALFDETASTQQLYDRQVRSIVDSAMKGINGTIFA